MLRLVMVNFPHVVEVKDYHEFEYLRGHFQNVFTKNRVKIKEVGCCGSYLGIAYLDRMDGRFKKLKKELKARIRAGHRLDFGQEHWTGSRFRNSLSL